MGRVPALRFPEFSGEWREVKLGEATSYVDYRGKAPEKTNQGIFLVTAKNIRKGYIDYSASKEFVPKEKYFEIMRKGLPLMGDILFTMEAPLGNVAQVDKEEIALAQRVIKLRAKNDLINKYLLYYLLSHKYQKLIHRLSFGTTVLGLSGKELRNTHIAIPSLPEQQKIADFLSAVDEKIAILTDKITRLEAYKKGMMQKLLSGELRFPGFTDAWREVKLGEVASISKGKQLNKLDMNDNGHIPVINGGVSPSGFTNVPNRKRNTITISEGGNSCGYVNYIDVDFWCGGHCYSIAEIETDVKKLFLFHLLKSIESFIMRLRVGSGLPNIQKKDINNLKLSIPSLPEQQKIADFLTAIDDKLTLEKERLEALKRYKQGLLQKMFV